MVCLNRQNTYKLLYAKKDGEDARLIGMILPDVSLENWFRIQWSRDKILKVEEKRSRHVFFITELIPPKNLKNLPIIYDENVIPVVFPTDFFSYGKIPKKEPLFKKDKK